MFSNSKKPFTVVNNPINDSVFSMDSNEITVNPPPPFDEKFWITNTGASVISSTNNYMVFGGPNPPPSQEFWIDNNNDYMVDSDGDYFIFGS